MSEMGFTCDRVTLHWCQHSELPASNTFGRKGGAPRSKLDGFENEDNRMPDPPQDTTLASDSAGGSAPISLQTLGLLVNLGVLGEGCPTMAF